MAIKAFFYYIVKLLNIAVTLAILVFCLFFVYLFYCNAVKMPVPKLGPITMYVVLSDSMAPLFRVDDAVFSIEKDPAALEVDDVIAFYAFEDNVTITHRIIEKEEIDGSYVFHTKGDNNNSPDNFTTPGSRVIGEIFYHIPRFNFYLSALKERPYVIVFPVILAVVFQSVFGFLEKVLKPVKPVKKVVLPALLEGEEFSENESDKTEN